MSIFIPELKRDLKMLLSTGTMCFATVQNTLEKHIPHIQETIDQNSFTSKAVDNLAMEFLVSSSLCDQKQITEFCHNLEQLLDNFG